MDYIVTKRKNYFPGYNFCSLDEIILPDKIAIDTESTGLDCYHTEEGFKGAKLFAIQIGTGKNNYLFDLEGGITPEEVFKLCEGRTLVLQNAIFDLRFFFKHDFFPFKIKDTMVASKILYNRMDGIYSHSFEAIFKRELNIIYNKSEQKNIAKTKLSSKGAIKYCFQDVDRLLELEEHLFNKLEENNQIEAYEFQCENLFPLAYMEMCGLPLHEKSWEKKIKEDEISLKDIEQEIKNYILEHLPHYREPQLNMFSSTVTLSVNLNSSSQMIPIFEELGLNIINDKGKKSLKEDIVSKNKHPFAKMWKTRQKLQKSLSTFGQNILDKVKGGRIYTSFNPIVDTGRISCRSGGINFLNFPSNKVTRSSFRALKGYKMVGADYSNQEVYFGADLHKDQATLDSIKKGICLHCAFAKVLYPELQGLSDKVIKTEHADKRQSAKSPRFAFQ